MKVILYVAIDPIYPREFFKMYAIGIITGHKKQHKTTNIHFKHFLSTFDELTISNRICGQ